MTPKLVSYILFEQTITDRLTINYDASYAVFGVELTFLLEREAANGEVLPGAIPFVIERCLYEIETRGLTEVGICTC